ncbi:MAG TPA: hypothetical protein VMV24_02085 [Candidatus Dormibacteraeota bacterium]|nr:hypothetical protein [Candidatus Dormibacteraeota bacterium]
MRSLAERVIESKINRIADPIYTISDDKRLQFQSLRLRFAQTELIRETAQDRPDIVRIHTNESIGQVDGECVSKEYLLEDGKLIIKSTDPSNEDQPVGMLRLMSILAKVALGQKIDSRLSKK